MSSNTSTAAANNTSGLQPPGTGAVGNPTKPAAAYCNDENSDLRLAVVVSMTFFLLAASRVKHYLWVYKVIGRWGLLIIDGVMVLVELGMMVLAIMAYRCNPPGHLTRALLAASVGAFVVGVETLLRGAWVEFWGPARAEKKKAKAEGEEAERRSPVSFGDAAGPQGSMRRRNVT